MSLVLNVDAERWHLALVTATDRYPGLVPVIKGNGYGFGARLLCGEATTLGVPLIAIGTYVEAAAALNAFTGDVLVMEPYRSRIHADVSGLADERLVHTVTSEPELNDLRGRVSSARAVVEGLTSMRRFGAPLHEVGRLASMSGAEGVTLHLPLGTGHVDEISTFVDAAPAVTRWFVSHVSPAELAALASLHPDLEFRPRVGTGLWLADPAAYEVRAHVLDVRPVVKGELAGYRQRPLPAGYLVVVSGGTSHGVAMESPASAATVRSRAIAVAEGVFEAAHRVRSPFRIGGTSPRFAEPPHMQCSLVVLAAGASPPAVGETVSVRMRLTTTYPDAVELH